MTTFDDQAQLERVTALDIRLRQRFPSRDVNRAMRLAARQRRAGPLGSTNADTEESDRPICIGGLELEITGGGTLRVLPGALLVANPSPVTETRPGSWSPAPAEADDDAYVTAELVAAATVTPASLPGGAGPYWWIVSVAPTLTTVESDSARVVFNEGTGVFDAATAAKIERWMLTVTLTAGIAGQSLGTVWGSVPGGNVVIGMLRVPFGATDLSAAIVYDCRPMPRNVSNQIGGSGEFGPTKTYTIGGAPPALGTALIAAPNTSIIRGEFWADISGERVRVRADNNAVRSLCASSIKEPGASWNHSASPTAPSLVWVYLCKVKGTVPRAVRQGFNAAYSPGGPGGDGGILEGAIVLSPTPPVGISANFHPGRDDLRPSAPLSLPAYNSLTMTPSWDYSGVTVPVTDALCLGPMIAVGWDAGTDTPLVGGVARVESDGWIGHHVCEGSSGTNFRPAIAAGGGMFATIAASYDDSVKTWTMTASLATIAAGKYMPIKGVRFMGRLTADPAHLADVAEVLPNPGRIHKVTGALAADVVGSFPEVIWPAEVDAGNIFAMARPFDDSTQNGGTGPFAFAEVVGVRWPFNEALAT